MNSVAPILVGVDFSSATPVLMRCVARWAAAGAPVILGHAIWPSEMRTSAAEDESGQEISLEDQIAEQKQRLERLLSEFAGPSPIRCEVRVGRPVAVLEQMALDHGAELVILGAHDLQHANRRLGTLAASAARRIPVDVLLVRDWQAGDGGTVAACVDFSAVSGHVIERAAALARLMGATLELIHVLYPPHCDPWGRVMEQPMDAQSSYAARVRERAQSLLSQLIADHAPALQGLTHRVCLLESISPSTAIAAHAEAHSIAWIVTGSHE
ncbi:MAG: universal stress protein, partial [Luteolibacter sp.]